MNIANSDLYVKVLTDKDMLFMYDQNSEQFENLSYEKQSLLETRDLHRSLINNFSEKHYEHLTSESGCMSEKEFYSGK